MAVFVLNHSHLVFDMIQCFFQETGINSPFFFSSGRVMREEFRACWWAFMPFMHNRPCVVGLSIPIAVYFFRVTMVCSTSCILHCMLQNGHWVSYVFSDWMSCCLSRKYLSSRSVKMPHPFYVCQPVQAVLESVTGLFGGFPAAVS